MNEYRPIEIVKNILWVFLMELALLPAGLEFTKSSECLKKFLKIMLTKW